MSDERAWRDWERPPTAGRSVRFIVGSVLAVAVGIAIPVTLTLLRNRVVAPSPSPSPSQATEAPSPSPSPGLLDDDETVLWIADPVRLIPVALSGPPSGSVGRLIPDLPVTATSTRTLFALGDEIIFGNGETAYRLTSGIDSIGFREIAPADRAIPSDRSDRLWLITDDGRAVTVREVDWFGNERTAAAVVPDGAVAAAVGDALVLDRGGTLDLWHPGTGQVLATIDGTFVAAGRARLVSCVSDAGPLQVLDVDDLETPPHSFALAPDVGPAVCGGSGEVSPSGDIVAVRSSPDGSPQILAVHLRTGGVVVVSDAAKLGSGAELLEWSPTGEWLFVAVADLSTILAYRPHDGASTSIALPEGVAIVTGLAATR